MLLCMHVEDEPLLIDLAELCPCSLQEAMERVGRMVELGVLELLIDDEPVLAHYPLPELLRSLVPANASQRPAASRPPEAVSRSVAPRSVRGAPTKSERAGRLPSLVPSELGASSPLPRSVAEANDNAASPDEDDAPPTGLRLRFEVDPRAARRALLGAIVLERRMPRAAVEAAGNRRVRRRRPSAT